MKKNCLLSSRLLGRDDRNHKILSQDSRCPVRVSNYKPSEHKDECSHFELTCSVAGHVRLTGTVKSSHPDRTRQLQTELSYHARDSDVTKERTKSSQWRIDSQSHSTLHTWRWNWYSTEARLTVGIKCAGTCRNFGTPGNEHIFPRKVRLWVVTTRATCLGSAARGWRTVKVLAKLHK